jgi:hypothetical protein
MLRNLLFALSTIALATGCSKAPVKYGNSLQKSLATLPHERGSQAYLASPFVAAGDRAYLVGHQDGSFPPIGWHINGEMGGIWDHPIKLLDGFDASLSLEDFSQFYCLNQASSFTNYPVGNVEQFEWKEQQLAVERFQFAPDGVEGLAVEFLFRNEGSETRRLKFIFNANFDVRPTWLGERTGMQDDGDNIQYIKENKCFLANDKSNPWFAAVGSTVEPESYSFQNITCSSLQGKPPEGASLTYALTLAPGEESVLTICIAGSYHAKSEALATLYRLQNEAPAMLNQKIARYDKIKIASSVEVPDTTIQKMLEWVKYTTDWLVRDVPEQGRGLGAGAPDYPWWFGCDSEYALQGALAAGQHELARSSIMLIKKLSDKTNGNGRIIHEASTNGAVYNRGNTNETAQFVSLVRDYYRWTGDRETIEKLFPDIIKSIRWLLFEMNPDGNLFPNGPGMTEISGLDSEMIDVAVYTQQALEAASYLAGELGYQEETRLYFDKAKKLKEAINSTWWVEEDRSFADFISTPDKAKKLIEAAIVRADTLKKMKAVDELKGRLQRLGDAKGKEARGFVVFHNAVVNSPMEVGIADPDKAKKALETARRYRNYFGAYITGIDRGDNDIDSIIQKARKKTFNYTGAVMTLSTGVLAIAEARYGDPDESLEYLKRLGHTFNYALPGSMYEVSPDFGMMAQAWNIYAVAVPIINHYFGVSPWASTKRVYLQPNLPSTWKNVSLNNLKVGDNSVSISIKTEENKTRYEISQTLPFWEIRLDFKNAKDVHVTGGESTVKPGNETTSVLMNNATKFVIEVDH